MKRVGKLNGSLKKKKNSDFINIYIIKNVIKNIISVLFLCITQMTLANLRTPASLFFTTQKINTMDR